ncbi:PAS domain-containing sensor histidine kinase [Halopenitus persicus]|uniref:histidine kinase n=1 Tax=Halopenitus persicus TaxID=1048396 RepID=A0A1H3LJI4_9EURY|nr:PAS domain-containing sensor histidine kinase [Halopenitus persicus]SDY64707.1 PAS domain S-box-containing protein [Halopenitus persicus]
MTRTLLVIETEENREALTKWLAAQDGYEPVHPDGDAPFECEFDLCIIDDPSLCRHRDVLVACQEDVEPVFLPALLVRSRSGEGVDAIGLDAVDEQIDSPIQKDTLAYRLENLVERRALSRRLATQLEETTNRYQKILQAANDAIIVFDPAEKTLLECNSTALSLFGYSAEELASMDLGRELITAEQEMFETFLESVNEQGHGWTDRFTCRTAAGDELRTEISASVLEVNDRPHVLLSIRDITERKREHARLTTLFENSLDAIAAVEFVDREPMIRAVNPAFEETFGYDADAIVGEAVVDALVPPDRAAELADHADRVLAGDHITTEVRRETKHGARELLLRAVPIEREARVSDAYAVYTDITKRKQREQQLQVLNRILRHNLRNDMNLIQGHASNLVDELAGRDAAADARKIEETAAGLVEMSQKADKINKLSQRGGVSHRADVVSIVEDVSETVQETSPDADIATELPESVIVLAPTQLDVAIRELCENAIKHTTDRTPEVTICVSPADASSGSIEIEILDNGPGIPEDERAVLAEGGETPFRHGSGLGLWMVNWIVASVGGEVDITDNEPHGSIVTLTLRPITDK